MPPRDFRTWSAILSMHDTKDVSGNFVEFDSDYSR